MTWEALDLALALHAAPARATELRARPLPSGIRNLLCVALGREQAVAEACAAIGQPGAHLVEAARFFVEQQLLARECEHDPWRVLGVEPGTEEAELRAHHHLLVRLVHPDRSDDWPSAYADRVNRAWRQLRGAEGRELVSASNAQAGAAGRSVVGEPWGERGMRPRPGLAPMPPPAHGPPPLPHAWARAAVLLVVCATVVLLWQQRPEPHSTSAAQLPDAPATTAVPTEPVAPPPSNPPQALVAIESLLPDPLPAPVREPSSPEAATAAQVEAPKLLVARTAPAPPSAPPAAVLQPEAPPPVPATVAEVTPPSQPADPTTAKPATAARAPAHAPSDAETLALLDRYTLLYAEGDLSGILALYARQVHNDHRLLAPIAAGYARVFDDTARRSIELDALKWQRHEDRITGQTRYKLNQQPRGGLWRRAERGRVDFELVRDGDTSRFLRFTSIADHGT